MKKLLSILLSFIFTIGLCGCDSPFNSKPKKAGYLLQADIISISVRSSEKYYLATSDSLVSDVETAKSLILDSKRVNTSLNYINKLKETTGDRGYIEMTDDLSHTFKKLKSIIDNIYSLVDVALADSSNSDIELSNPDNNSSSTFKEKIDNDAREGKKYYDNFLKKYKAEKKALGDMSNCYVPESSYKDYVTQLKFILENTMRSRKYMPLESSYLEKKFADTQLSIVDPALKNARLFKKNLPSDADKNVKKAVNIFIDELSMISEEYHYTSKNGSDNPDSKGYIVRPAERYSEELKEKFYDFNDTYKYIR